MTYSLKDFISESSQWPTNKVEAWKYFNFKKLGSEHIAANIEFSDLKVQFSDAIEKDVIKVRSDEMLISSSLKDSINASILDKNVLLNSASALDYRFSELNFRHQWFFLEVFDQKIETIYLKYESENEGVFSPSLRVNLKNVKVDITEDFSAVKAKFSKAHTQFDLQNSNVQHVVLHSEEDHERCPIFHTCEAHLKDQSYYSQVFMNLNKELLRQQVSVSVDSSESETELMGFGLTSKEQFCEVRTEVIHTEPLSTSRQVYKTIAADQSQSVFNGRIYIAQKAQKTDSSQLCKGMLLNSKAEINAKPELEIYADDVKAAHGAAIGQMGSDQLFYLVSRGISYEMAYELLAKAFTGEVTQQIRSAKLRQEMNQKINTFSQVLFERLVQSLNKGIKS